MSKDMPPAGSDPFRGIGGRRAQRILRKLRHRQWIRNNEKLKKKRRKKGEK